MTANSLYFCGLFAAGLPLLATAVLLVLYFRRRAVWRRKRRRGEKIVGFCPSSAALGTAFLFLQIFIRPSLQHLAEIRQEQDTDEDDSGDPDSPEKNFHRQLKRIRRGEQVSDLTLWM
ncbi:MAG TPA: hypothetical protein VGR47_04255 [Terracidiphilus sp.]|nr:hypothetical protein [Terracidiphilus sp.]